MKSIAEHYLSTFKRTTFIIKIGGEVIQNKKILENILRDVKYLVKRGIYVILVHGGGPQADILSAQLGHTPRKVGGRRITQAADLEIAKMLYGGSLNLEILSILKKLGIAGIRVSGVDGDLLDVEQRKSAEVNYGFVGDIKAVNQKILRLLLNAGYVPVVSPLAVTKNGTIVNVNADTIAVQLAIATKATKLILFTNTDGVWIKEKLVSVLTTEQAEKLIRTGEASGGMAVKLQNCIEALENGVRRIHIINGLSEHSLLKEVLTRLGIGTMLVGTREKQAYEKE